MILRARFAFDVNTFLCDLFNPIKILDSENFIRTCIQLL